MIGHGVEPVALNGLIELLLGILQVELCLLLLDTRLADGEKFLAEQEEAISEVFAEEVPANV